MKPAIRLAVALVSILSAVAQAELVINVGDHLLAPNTPGNQVQIFITGDLPVQGMNFNAVIGDGGSTLGGVDDVVPAMTADILTATIFAPDGANAVNLNPTGAFGVGLAAWSVTTTAANTGLGSGLRLANGLLVTLTIDTTGFGGMFSFPLILDSPNAGATDFAGGPAVTIINGTVSVVPEPSSLALALLAAAGVGATAIRKRRMAR